jgi:hypothetical protein
LWFREVAGSGKVRNSHKRHRGKVQNDWPWSTAPAPRAPGNLSTGAVVLSPAVTWTGGPRPRRLKQCYLSM